jgi:predicted MPP superfamily phosphohydrolase
MDGNPLTLERPATRDRAIACAAPRFVFDRPRRGPWLQLVDTNGFEWNRLTVAIDNLPPALNGLRVLHLSDLHLRPRWLRAYDELIEGHSANPPDLIAVTGDFVEHRMNFRKTLPTLQRLVTGLTSRLGTFAILGNHDGDLLGPRLLDWGVHLVSGRTALLESSHAGLEIVGVPSVSRLDPVRAFVDSVKPRQPGVPRVVLAHFPDSIDKLDPLAADLVLAGHTHGGQCCLPGGLPLVTHDSLPRRMSKGVHELPGGALLVVSRGLGFATLPLRVFCPAEVIEIRLEQAPQRATQNGALA